MLDFVPLTMTGRGTRNLAYYAWWESVICAFLMQLRVISTRQRTWYLWPSSVCTTSAVSTSHTSTRMSRDPGNARGFIREHMRIIGSR